MQELHLVEQQPLPHSKQSELRKFVTQMQLLITTPVTGLVTVD
jgi:hypothetical protein